MKRQSFLPAKSYRILPGDFTISGVLQRCLREAVDRRQTNLAQTSLRSDGFTIIELMIATMVFSVIVLVITIGVLSFTTDYYKGINNSTTQTTTQAAIDTVSQAIQFSSGGTTATVAGQNYFCAGDKLIVYDIGKSYQGNPASSAGLYVMPRVGSVCAYSPPNGGKELLAKNMRLSYINVSLARQSTGNGGDNWKVELHIAYGDPDLLCDMKIGVPAAGSCDATAAVFTTSDTIASDDIRCRRTVGSQYCSIGRLATIVQQRIQ